MLSVSYTGKNAYSAGKTDGVLRAGASGANRDYVLAQCASLPLHDNLHATNEFCSMLITAEKGPTHQKIKFRQFQVSLAQVLAEVQRIRKSSEPTFHQIKIFLLICNPSNSLRAFI